jgi:hypothetical protein
VVAVVCARPSASAGSYPSVGSQGLPAPFGSFPHFIFDTSDSQAIRVFRSYVPCHKLRGSLASTSSTSTFSGWHPSLTRQNGPPSSSYVDHYTSLAFDHLQSLLRERCKSVERSRTKHNSIRSSKSRCRARKREVFGRHCWDVAFGLGSLSHQT